MKMLVQKIRWKLELSNIQRASDGLIVLGSPIGSQSFVSSTVKCVIDNIAGTMVKCRKLENPQEELLLLRNCTGAPESHLLAKKF